MVKKMRMLTLLMCVTWPYYAQAIASLTVKVDKKTIVLGEALIVELRVEEGSEPLSNIKLDQVKQNFNIYGISSTVLSQNKKGRSVRIETMTLTLYPFSKGRVQLPALSYRGKSSQPIWVEVVESSQRIPRVIFQRALDTAHAQVRQAATLSLEIYDDGSLQWTAPREIIADGAHQRILAESQRVAVLDGISYTIQRYSWAITPLRAGGIQITFPMLDAFKFGTRLRYAVAPVWINAAPVPAYLQVHVPIGKPVIEFEPLAHEIALDRPVNWIFRVQSASLSVEGLGKLLSNLRSNETIRFYPSVISALGNDRASTATQILQVSVPFVPLRTGILTLPEINLPYYDPASARVESVLMSGATVEVFNPLSRMLLKIMLLLAGLALGIALAYWAIKQLQRSLLKRRSLLAISRAVNANELRVALLNFDLKPESGRCATLQQWLKNRQQKNGVEQRLLALVEKLERVNYGLAQENIANLAKEASQILRKVSRY